MTRRHGIGGLASLAVATTLVSGEVTRTPGLESYARAREILDAGVRAIGGEEALRVARVVRRQMSGDWYGSGQGSRPEPFLGPTLTPPRSNARNRIMSLIDYAGNRWFDEAVESESTTDEVTRITAVAEDQGFETITYRDERPFHRDFHAQDLPALRAGRLRRYPEGLLRMALDRPEGLEWVGEGTELGRKQRVVSFTDPVGARVLLYFDAETNLLTKSEILRSHAIAGDSFSDVVYDDYRAVERLRLPFHCIDRRAGVPTEETRARSIELNVIFPEERWQSPSDFARMLEDPPGQSVEQLGEDLYMIRGPYNSIFAVFRDDVVVFEAPLSGKYSKAGLDLVHVTAPGKPIRCVVSTHFHFDHVAGVRTYVAEGVPIVTTPDAKGVIERVASAQHTMHPDALSRSPQSPRVETVTDKRVFDDGTNRAELYDFGPTEHVAQMLVAYFPKQKVLFVADLWDIVSTDLVIAGSDAVTLAQRIRERGLQVERIIPVHGVPGTMEMLNNGLAIRAKYFK